jgi:hypothetical protein
MSTITLSLEQSGYTHVGINIDTDDTISYGDDKKTVLILSNERFFLTQHPVQKGPLNDDYFDPESFCGALTAQGINAIAGVAGYFSIEGLFKLSSWLLSNGDYDTDSCQDSSGGWLGIVGSVTGIMVGGYLFFSNTISRPLILKIATISQQPADQVFVYEATRRQIIYAVVKCHNDSNTTFSMTAPQLERLISADSSIWNKIFSYIKQLDESVLFPSKNTNELEIADYKVTSDIRKFVILTSIMLLINDNNTQRFNQQFNMLITMVSSLGYNIENQERNIASKLLGTNIMALQTYFFCLMRAVDDVVSTKHFPLSLISMICLFADEAIGSTEDLVNQLSLLDIQYKDNHDFGRSIINITSLPSKFWS